MVRDIYTTFQRHTDAGWKAIPSNYDETRDYALFAVLAGGYNETQLPILPLRGLPSDFKGKHEGGIGEVTLYMGDYSHSWLTGAEMLDWWVGHSAGYSYLAYFFEEIQRLVDLHGEIRMVFGFDR